MGHGRWRQARAARLALLSATVALALTQAASGATGGPEALPHGTGTAVPVGLFPFGATVDPTRRTLYVANNGETTLSIIDARACSAAHTRGCRRPVATVPLPSNPVWVEADPATHTLYVTIGGANDDGHTVVVLDTSTCNARTTADCRVVATVHVGRLPVVARLDTAHHTVYVANVIDGTVSLIDAETCNAVVTTGCAGRMPTIPVGASPDAGDLDSAHHTLYIANADDATVSVIDTSRCNAGRLSGCGGPVATAAVGGLPFWIAVDPAVHTAYIATNAGITISMIDTRSCSAAVTHGCSRPAATAPVGANPSWAGVDRLRHTVYVANANDATLSVLDASTCNAHVTAGCAGSPTLRVGWDPEAGYVDAAHGTVYVVNRVAQSVSVVASATCNATRTSGCRRPVATAPAGAVSADLAVDRSTHTVYVANAGGSVSLLDGASCNAHDRSGCRRTPPAVSMSEPDDLAVDPAHHTLYVSNFLEHGTVTMIDTTTCRTGRTRGCAGPHPAFPVGAFPGGLALNPRTHTLYAADTTGTLTVVDTATCNAHHRAGCEAHALTVAIPKGAFRMAVDRTTGTVYVGQFGVGDSNGTRVTVVDGSTCNAIRHTGCGKAHATITLPVGITGLLVDETTRTLYVAHHDPVSNTGIVSVIDITRCNGTTAAGCHTAPTDLLAPYAPVGLALDPRTHLLYVTGAFDSSVWIFDARRCTGSDRRGCGSRPRLVEVGSTPHAAELDPATGTLYAPNVVAGDVSLVPLASR